jgi:hypothetical protein
MNRLFLIFIVVSALLFSVSCGGGDKNDKCPEGYTWNGSECEKDSVINPDKDTIVNYDEDPKNDTDPADDDSENDESGSDDDSTSYTGDCTEVKAGGTLEINVQTKNLTIGEITINGESDDTNLSGELWGENKATLSEFKIADIDGTLSGKKFKIPVGRYDFLFKSASYENRITLLENIDMASGDRTLDFEIPLFHFTGSVLKNGAAFTVEAGMEDATKIKLKSGTYEKIIPYSDFGAFDVVVPKGTYSVYFEGQLASGQGVFKGTILSSTNGIEIEEDVDSGINVETVTFSGNAVNEGYDVSTGQIIIVENPPFDNPSAVIIPDLATKAYSVTMTKGAQFNVLYLPETDSYPVKYIKLELWDDLSAGKTHDIILDFARLHGTVTFLGNASLPSVSECTGADCTRGKLKLAGFDYSSLVIKDFGTTGEDLTYDALVVRRTKNIVPDPENPPDGTKVVYNPKTYTMNFESHLNNVKGAFEYSPFTLPLKYLNSESVPVSNFTFQNVAEEYVLEKEINFNITPMLVEGTVTLNGSAFTTEKDDLIKIRDLNGIETPVINLSELSDGTFSFLVPTGEYDVIYEGEGVLGSEFKTYIERNLNVTGNMSGQTLGITTSKIVLGLSINGTPFKEWAQNNKTLNDYQIVVNPDKTAANYLIDIVKPTDGDWHGEVISGLTINAYLDLFFTSSEKEKKSFMRIPLLVSHSMSSDKTVDTSFNITEYSTTVKINSSAVTGASDYIAQLQIQGQNRTEVFYPASGTEAAKALFRSGEHKSPRPELILNEGFDTKQTIELNCIYFGE